MSALSALKSASDLGELAALLGCKPAALSYIIYKQPDAGKYMTFEIPKRRGGKRTIKAPNNPLKVIQQRLSNLLQDCLEEIERAKGKRDRVAHGFKRQRSIRSNAK
jgi:RNA-directed DNA polymerase